MAGLKPLFTSSAGIKYQWDDSTQADGHFRIVASQDVAPVLERNKAMANENAGWSPSKEMRRVGSIPLILIQKWKEEEGWDAFDPACEDKLRAKLNDPDYRHLRSAEWRF